MIIELEVYFYHVILLATTFVGATFSSLLILTKRINQKANVFLGLVLTTITLWIVWVLGIDLDMGRYFPNWSFIPFQYSLTIGPLIYFYVRKITSPDFKIRGKNLLHFSPVLVELAVHYFQTAEGILKNIPTFRTAIFFQYNPILQLLATISVLVYLLAALKEIKKFDLWLKDHYSDVYKYQLQWLKRLLTIFGFFWALWVPYLLVDYFAYDYMLDTRSYYPLYICLAIVLIWLGVEAFLKPEALILEPRTIVDIKKEDPSIELINAGIWLKSKMDANLFHRNSELTLRSLAEELNIHPNELSRITNSALGKSFNDFINEYRVNDFILKLHDPKFKHITLLGIAFDSGFNSKTTFNRTFKSITGKSPLEYKNMTKMSPEL